MSVLTKEQRIAIQRRLDAWHRLHRLSDEQRNTLKRRLKGMADDEKVEELIQHIERKLARVAFFHGKGPTIDTTILDKHDPVMLKLELIQKQATDLLQTLDSMTDEERALLNYQWDLCFVLTDPGMLTTPIDDPLATVRTFTDSLREQAEVTLHAHGKLPGAPRDLHREAKGFALAFAIREVLGCTFEPRSRGRKILRIVMRVCIDGYNDGLARTLFKQPGLGQHLPRKTREIRRAKH